MPIGSLAWRRPSYEHRHPLRLGSRRVVLPYRGAVLLHDA